MNYTLLALVVSAFSLLVSFIAFKRNDKYKRIEKTPVLLPTLSQKGEQVLVQFESKENHAFNINITFSGGKIPTQMTFTESFVGGDFKSRKFPIKKDILDGCSIDVN